MSITLNGSSGIVGANGSVSAPAVTGGDPASGIFFPAANTVGVSVGGVERFRSNVNGTFVTSMNVATLNVGTLNVTSMNVTTISSPSLSIVSGGNTGDIVIATTPTKSGYLLCDGSIYTRSSYYPLANSIGIPYSFSVVTANTMANTNSGLIYEANGVLYRTGQTASLNATLPIPGGLMTSTNGINWTYVTGAPINSTGGTLYAGGYNNMAMYGNNFTVLVNSGWANSFTTVYYQYGIGSNTTGPFTSGSYAPTSYNSYFPVINEVAYGGSLNRFVTSSVGFNQSVCVQTNAYWDLYYMGNPSTPVSASRITNIGSTSVIHYAGVAGNTGEFIASSYFYGGSSTSSGSYNIVLRSTDGATWGNVTANVVSALSNSSDVITSVSYSPHTNKYYITTLTGQILQSGNGANYTWSSVATNTRARHKIRTAYSGNGGTIYYYSNDALQPSGTIAGNTVYSSDLVNWSLVPTAALAPAILNFVSVAQPNNSTRIYGSTVAVGGSWFSRANSATYYVDLFNYNTTTQFPVPYLSFSLPIMSNNSPVGYNTIAANYFIKT